MEQNKKQKTTKQNKQKEKHMKKQKHRKIPQKGKKEQLQFASIDPSPRVTLLSVTRELPSWNECHSLGKRDSKGAAAPAFGVCMKDQCWFHLTERPAKLRCIDVVRNKEEGQRLPISAMQLEL